MRVGASLGRPSQSELWLFLVRTKHRRGGSPSQFRPIFVCSGPILAHVAFGIGLELNMASEPERLPTNVEAEDGFVFLSDVLGPSAISPEEALALADVLTDAAVTAVGQQAIAKLQRGEEWI